MQINDVVTLENNEEFLILDITELNHEKYLYCVGIDKNDMPTKEYIYLRGLESDNGLLVEKVEDEDLMKALTALFTANFVSENINDEQDA